MPFLCPGFAARRAIAWRAFTARDGRDSPLKYTARGRGYGVAVARDGRDSPLKYTWLKRIGDDVDARDGRDSPLKYTALLVVLHARLS